MKVLKIKKNEGKIYEIGGPTTISFKDMVKSIDSIRILNKKIYC